jgi:hypothetical protein
MRSSLQDDILKEWSLSVNFLPSVSLGSECERLMQWKLLPQAKIIMI